MKTRQSGMPDEQMWNTFFDPCAILDKLGIQNVVGNIADLACGYGTFTIPAARRTKGVVYAIDIDEDMIRITRKKVRQNGIKNVTLLQRNFVTGGTGLADSCCDRVLLFNILHVKKPLKTLAEAKRILTSKGKVSIIHWNYDPTTPRGPAMSIRPKPEQCQNWLIEAGFKLEGTIIPLPPYHYGLTGIKL